MYGTPTLWQGSCGRGKSGPLGTLSQGLVDGFGTAYNAGGQRTKLEDSVQSWRTAYRA